ncbi:MAG: threonylcarbamoyl-AMP synthase [Myxococcales bacterium]|nr:threonylcarbamoyl-AMP synthase [Myxococcales bacterium]
MARTRVAQMMVIDAERPHPRKLRMAGDVLREGGVIAYPTDTVYGIGCDVTNRKGIDRVYRIKGLDREHQLAFICPDIATVAEYAHVTDFAYRWLRRLFPGPYTVILPATRAVPKVLRESRSEIGVRIPASGICSGLVEALGQPIITTSASDPETDLQLIDADVVRDVFGTQLDLVIDGGLLTSEPSTVVSLLDNEIEILREGKGPVDMLVG